MRLKEQRADLVEMQAAEQQSYRAENLYREQESNDGESRKEQDERKSESDHRRCAAIIS